MHDTLQNFRETGKNGDGSILLISLGSPPLKSGVTLATFKAFGKTPFSMDFPNRYLRG